MEEKEMPEMNGTETAAELNTAFSPDEGGDCADTVRDYEEDEDSRESREALDAALNAVRWPRKYLEGIKSKYKNSPAGIIFQPNAAKKMLDMMMNTPDDGEDNED